MTKVIHCRLFAIFKELCKRLYGLSIRSNIGVILPRASYPAFVIEE